MTEFRYFLDTNLLVYLYSNDQKSVTVEKLIYSYFNEICLSIQVLNELYSVLIRKNLKLKEEAQIIIKEDFKAMRETLRLLSDRRSLNALLAGHAQRDTGDSLDYPSVEHVFHELIFIGGNI